MINTAPPASNSVYGREKLFWYDKIIFTNHVCHCGAVVKELLAPADKPGSTPGDALSVSLYRFFFPRSCLVSFSTLFFLLAFFSLFSLLTLLVMHLDQNWYFNLKCGVLFWKRISKALDLHTGRAYWRAENTHNVKYNTSFAEPPIAVSKLLSLAVHWPSKVWPVGMIVH